MWPTWAWTSAGTHNRLENSAAEAQIVVAAACSSDPSSAPADSGADRFDIDQDTPLREVFDALTGAEQV